MITLKCHGCGTVGSVNRVTAGLRCTCGSDDLDLFSQADVTFLEFMSSSGGTGWGEKRPDPLKGWDEYAGPMPGANPRSAPTPNGAFTCPECKGAKVDIRDGGICRACKGTGTYRSPTSVSPEPYVKKHNYPSTQTSTPFMGRRRTAAPARVHRTPEEVIKSTTPGWMEGHGVTGPAKMPNTSPHVKTRDDEAAGKLYSDEGLAQRRKSEPYAMHEADCPQCGHAPTHLVNDYKGDAWWHCPNCGPLENIDRKPQIDPYNPPADFKANPRSFKSGSRNANRVQTGRILPMLATVRGANPGLSPGEALGIVRITVSKYSE